MRAHAFAWILALSPLSVPLAATETMEVSMFDALDPAPLSEAQKKEITQWIDGSIQRFLDENQIPDPEKELLEAQLELLQQSFSQRVGKEAGSSAFFPLEFGFFRGLQAATWVGNHLRKNGDISTVGRYLAAGAIYSCIGAGILATPFFLLGGIGKGIVLGLHDKYRRYHNRTDASYDNTMRTILTQLAQAIAKYRAPFRAELTQLILGISDEPAVQQAATVFANQELLHRLKLETLAPMVRLAALDITPAPDSFYSETHTQQVLQTVANVVAARASFSEDHLAKMLRLFDLPTPEERADMLLAFYFMNRPFDETNRSGSYDALFQGWISRHMARISVRSSVRP